ncbi:hypothetical protein PV328_005098 [Microctonus aethiopoides]|uniref:Odorant receptor n=1 Tax=Microctonus aethiopoides TaxID=144406 RepID=A0AA39FLL0_9HYME|nr:hypothetical protein PV328_005098 [Microctonus aethiopoides]
MEWAMVVDRALRRVRVILIAKSWEEASLEIDRAQYPRSYELSARLSRKDEKQKIKEKDIPKEEGALPIRAFYPFDISSSPLYELAFSFQAFTVSYGLLSIVLMDELVITLIRWINVQLKILGSNYEKCRQNFTEPESFNVINRDGNITNCYDRQRMKEEHTEIRSFVPFKQQEADEMNDSFVWRFKTCAQNHQRFIDIVDELNSIFGSSMLMQLFASFSMICLTAFQAALGSEGTQNLMKFVIYLGAACSQLMNWCWFGNELLYQSTSLTTSQWLCGWEDKYSDVKTFMIISLIRTKYPLQLKAGKFYNIMGGILMIALIFFVPKNEGDLPIRAAYPFDTTISPMHEFAAVTQMFAVAYGLAAILLMDTIGLGFMRWINVQLIILTSNYQNCTSQYQNKNHLNTSGNNVELIKSDMSSWMAMDGSQDLTEISTFVPFMDNEFDVENNFIQRFKKCVINHRRLIRIIDDINITFSGSMLMQLFASFTMICLTGFQAVLGAKEKSNLMKFGIYLGAAFTQLLYWCWYGNELFYQKHSLLVAQWMSGWENQLNSTSKILIIMSMIRTMQPLELKAGAFFTMSMETFITVVKSSYSFFALLTTVTTGEN